MITREDVADLREGDVVRLDCGEDPGTSITGPVRLHGGNLQVGTYILRTQAGQPFYVHQSHRTLTVISRAAPPLYVNSDKTEPDPGDVVRDADPDGNETWAADGNGGWLTIPGAWLEGNQMPPRLRLLVDGRSGQVVP